MARRASYASIHILLLLSLILTPSPVSAHGGSARLASLLAEFPPERVPSGILYDRVVPLSATEEYSGTPEARPAAAAEWRQMYDEIRRASLRTPSWPPLGEIERAAAGPAREGVQTLALMNFRYERFRSDALETGALIARDGHFIPGEGEPLLAQRVVAAAAFPGRTYRGEEVRFRLPASPVLTNDPARLRAVEVDFDDGRGYEPMAPGEERVVRYDAAGEKTLRIRLSYADGPVLYAGARFEVKALRTPTPDDTLHITASIPYGGTSGQGDAYVYLSSIHSTLTEPVIVIEGFDYDNSMNWDELYDLLNRENLLENMRALGFDAVVLNFSDAVDYIQRNAFVAVELLQQVQATVGPDRTVALVGASMGGLIGRYALDYMETNALAHHVRTFLSFDSPQNGANIPLGLQYWLWFFADDSADAAALLAALDTPGARQMLAYHHTDPPSGAGQSDPLRAQLLTDFAALGDFPSQPRKVAIANGSGLRLGQGFLPGAQVIRWEYSSFLVDIIGNVWAVRDAASGTIFHGLIDPIFLPADESTVTVSGTRPFDSGPGGWKDSMAEMDATPAPYGDIVALYPNHCFIPTVSALALDTTDLFYDIDGDPDILAHTPFDAVYYPTGGENQEHVAITPENAAWFLAEVSAGPSTVEAIPSARPELARIQCVAPNPIHGQARIRCLLPRSGPASLTLHDVLGRRVAVLAAYLSGPGERELEWSGSSADGRRVVPGVYFLRLQGNGFSAREKIVVR